MIPRKVRTTHARFSKPKAVKIFSLDQTPYLEGQGDVVNRLITPITHIVTLIIPIINLLT